MIDLVMMGEVVYFDYVVIILMLFEVVEVMVVELGVVGNFFLFYMVGC